MAIARIQFHDLPRSDVVPLGNYASDYLKIVIRTKIMRSEYVDCLKRNVLKKNEEKYIKLFQWFCFFETEIVDRRRQLNCFAFLIQWQFKNETGIKHTSK